MKIIYHDLYTIPVLYPSLFYRNDFSVVPSAFGHNYEILCFLIMHKNYFLYFFRSMMIPRMYALVLHFGQHLVFVEYQKGMIPFHIFYLLRI